ncbi:hypothetical protein E2C01_046371 [Portunus trituberculatus]|uniref:Uncharacterized protein n=1 Tax=Portunus trituberculatus TaxID=210409 RepID=A0A5B7FYA6_PORTR|nr:hypothetical protein [Portunus trituberculatus]
MDFTNKNYDKVSPEPRCLDSESRSLVLVSCMFALIASFRTSQDKCKSNKAAPSLHHICPLRLTQTLPGFPITVPAQRGSSAHT